MKQFYGFLAVLVCLIGFGCAAPEIDEVMLATQLQDAQQAIHAAAELEAESLVPEEYGRAVKLLSFARNSQEIGDVPQSAEFAYQSELVAQIASAKARQHHARQNAVSLREQIYQEIIKTHEYELEIARIQEALIQEQLARTRTARDAGEQQASQLSSEIAALKDTLRQADLRLALGYVSADLRLAQHIYGGITETAEYERLDAAIASITDLIEQRVFTEAEMAIAEAQTLADTLYQTAKERYETEMAATTNALILIATAETLIQRAESLNASEHAPADLRSAKAQVKTARDALAAGRYAQAQNAAERSRKDADKTIQIAEAAEFRSRAAAAEAQRAAAATAAVEALKSGIEAQAQTQVPQLEARLYELASAAHAKAATELQETAYETALQTAQEGTDYLERAVANTKLMTSAKSDLLKAARQIPKATTIEQRDSVLVRVNGNVFPHGSTQLQQDFFETFEALAALLRKETFSRYVVRIEVHTGAVGTASVNRNVSIGRADSLKRFLTEAGQIAQERIEVEGLGETQPLVTDGPDKEELNRRIDVIIKTR